MALRALVRRAGRSAVRRTGLLPAGAPLLGGCGNHASLVRPGARPPRPSSATLTRAARAGRLRPRTRPGRGPCHRRPARHPLPGRTPTTGRGPGLRREGAGRAGDGPGVHHVRRADTRPGTRRVRAANAGGTGRARRRPQPRRGAHLRPLRAGPNGRTACPALGAHGPVYGPLGDRRRPAGVLPGEPRPADARLHPAGLGHRPRADPESLGRGRRETCRRASTAIARPAAHRPRGRAKVPGCPELIRSSAPYADRTGHHGKRRTMRRVLRCPVPRRRWGCSP